MKLPYGYGSLKPRDVKFRMNIVDSLFHASKFKGNEDEMGIQ
jgi:hypothetical protein